MTEQDIRTHEITFCSRVSKWADSFFQNTPSTSFKHTEIEESKGIKRKRSDLRAYGANNRLILAGEVKLPGTVEGRNPYNAKLVEDSYQKASNAGAEFFFTWNVNKFVLFDQKKWNLPIMERRVKEYDLGLDLDQPEDVSRSEVEKRIQKFIADLFSDLQAIIDGKPDWGIPPDEFFIRAFESHISWPVKLTAEFLWAESAANKKFNSLLQEWMAGDQGWIVMRNDEAVWRMLVDRAARTLCYVFANRLLFYESVRRNFDELKELRVPKKAISADEIYLHFQKLFQKAVDATGDYETLFYPFEKDWAGPLIFCHEHSLDAWRSVLENLRPFNFKEIRTDILGGIFKRLIAPEERHKFGQHYTSEDLVDVINAFCVRHAEANMLDPAAGSGSFVVRGYHRKAWLKQKEQSKPTTVSHQDWLRQIYAVDISLFAAHLCTLNLAARDIRDEENYPRVRRGNFFEVAASVTKKKPFCLLPQGSQGARIAAPVPLPALDAIVGNPPYVRQELIPRRGQRGVKPMQAKEDFLELCARFWNNLRLSGRSDLHCYFWPVSTHFLKDGGWFGFLVSSSWLDVEYGFALQSWVLSNFKIQAILESNAEPWFEDARVKTCAVILQKCADAKERNAQLVKFVRLDTPLKSILGERLDENARQKSVEEFRDEILGCKTNVIRDGWRVVVKGQKDLWEEGLRAGRLFEMQKQRDLEEGIATVTSSSDDEEDSDEDSDYGEEGIGLLPEDGGLGSIPKYGGGKWGKYLRAPKLYFEIMEKYGDRFVPLGEIATIRFGVKSGCDAFFMPRDVSQKFLDDYSMLGWNNAPLHTHCKRQEVESGKVKLILAGDGTVHPVEAQYLKPEVHSLMKVSRPLVVENEIDRFILFVPEPMSELKGTYVLKYLRYGEKTPFSSKKSKAVPVPSRPTCAGRERWYDLTYTKCGHLVWPKSQQYRHIIVHNKSRLIVNCNLYDVTILDGCSPELLAGILNSTLVGLIKIYFGRYAGTEGNLKTEVVDVNLLEVPDPRYVSSNIAKKLSHAFEKLSKRDSLGMVEEEFMACRHSERIRKLAEKPVGLPQELRMPDRRALDLAVFELLGVSDAGERERLCDELYYETANHFRQIRIVEVLKQEQRAGTDERGFRTDELAEDLWDSIPSLDRQPLLEWIAAQVKKDTVLDVFVPEGPASLPDANDLLDPNTIFFHPGRGSKASITKIVLPSRSHVEIIFLLTQQKVHGSLLLPKTKEAASALLVALTERMGSMEKTANELSRSRTGDEKRAAEVAALLKFWLVHGKPTKGHNN